MSHHYNASQAPGSVDEGIATLPEPDRSEAQQQAAVVEPFMRALAELYGFEDYSASINGMHASGLCSINVMLTAAAPPPGPE